MIARHFRIGKNSSQQSQPFGQAQTSSEASASSAKTVTVTTTEIKPFMINVRNGTTLALWSFARYAFNSKRRRAKLIPGLWKAVALLGVVTSLA